MNLLIHSVPKNKVHSRGSQKRKIKTGRGKIQSHTMYDSMVEHTCVCVCVAQSCPTLQDSMDYRAPLSSELSRQEYWSGLPFPSPGNLPSPRSIPGLLHCSQILYHLGHQGNPDFAWSMYNIWYPP